MKTFESQESKTTYILSEIDKLRYTYGLNKVIRYQQSREEVHQTQSVAEHVTNIMFCAYYFREIEDPHEEMDFDKVIRLILMHDLGEIETGDIVTTKKNGSDIEKEKEAIKHVIEKSPDFISREVAQAFEGFEDPKTVEERFARAMDKFEGMLFWFSDEGISMIKTVSSNDEIRGYFDKLEPVLEKLNFPTVIEYARVIKEDALRRGLLE